jgi:hypothetical protein
MPSAIAIVGLVICLSLLESLWTWLLVAAISEVAGQVHPPLLVLTGVSILAWIAARALALVELPLERRRFALVGGGLILAFAAATIHSGLTHPGQLIFGTYTPDMRGAGITLLVVTAYLWARGLRLAGRLGREQVINHVGVSAAGLFVILVFLPLTDAIQRLGLTIVVCSFLVSVAALLLIQLAGVETRRLSRLHWLGVAGGASLLVLIASTILTGAFSAESVGLIGDVARAVTSRMSPVTDAVLLAAGYLAQLEFNFIQMARSLFSREELQNIPPGDIVPTPVLPDGDPTPRAPEILVVIAGVAVIAIFILLVAWIFYRLVGNRVTEDDELTEDRGRAAGPGLLGMLRDAFGRFGQREPDDLVGVEARRAAIRRHYRAFQNLMARSGLPRGEGQTPREFQSSLRSVLSEADPAVEELTQAYVVARYAQPDADVPDPAPLEASVLRVRDALRARDPVPPTS